MSLASWLRAPYCRDRRLLPQRVLRPTVTRRKSRKLHDRLLKASNVFDCQLAGAVAVTGDDALNERYQFGNVGGHPRQTIGPDVPDPDREVVVLLQRALEIWIIGRRVHSAVHAAVELDFGSDIG